MLAQRGMSELTCMPGSLVGIEPNGPPLGRPGLDAGFELAGRTTQPQQDTFLPTALGRAFGRRGNTEQTLKARHRSRTGHTPF